MKSILVVFFVFLAGISFTQTNSFTVSGKIKGLDSRKMFIVFRDESGVRRDSILVNNESFSYTSPINKITYFSISPGVERVVKKVDRGYIPAKSSLLQFIASPGAHIQFSGKITDFVDAYPTGDAANNDLAKLNKEVYPLMNESVNLSLKVYNKIVTDSVEIKKILKRIQELDDKVIAIKEKFINDNPSSVAAIWLLSDMMVRTQLSNEKASELFKKMNKETLVAVPYYAEVAKRVDAIAATSVGQIVPDINSTNTYDGKRFDLSSLRGKYVVIDFWGTWCGPCVAGMPKMKEYHEKYKSKLEIVGVAQESDNGDRWRKFLDTHPDYRWHQVLSRDNEDYILKFNVAGFPTKMIVDPEGKIVARYVGEDDEIYHKLDELLK